MTKAPEEVIAAARAILNAIDRDEVYVGSTDDLKRVTIDGQVDILAIASAAIQAESDRALKRIAYEATKAKVTTADPARSVRFQGVLIITHPDMPPHVWDGEKLTRLTVGIDHAELQVEP